MPRCFDPRLDVLPAAQRRVWDQLSKAAGLSYVLYGGTAVALHLGHRQSVDFDFFRSEPLDKGELLRSIDALSGATILQEDVNTFTLRVDRPDAAVKVSFFGGIGFGRIGEPLQSREGRVLVASLDDLLATKLKAILDRAEARDYRDIAAMLEHGTPLDRALAAFREMFHGEPATVLRAIGYFEDGDLPSLDGTTRAVLRRTRDEVGDLPEVRIKKGSLGVPPGPCE